MTTIPEEFRRSLRDLLNRHNIDSITNTPDFLLVEFICSTIESYRDMQSLLTALIKRT